MKQIYFTVTNDLTYDQRMNRICSSLAGNGFDVTLIGRRIKNSKPLQQKSFQQKRLHCFFNKGFLFYAEYNLRLFFFLLFKKMDGICAIDLDTILPCLFISKLKSTKRIYDAHEFFTEMKEVRTRPVVQKFWLAVEKFTVPKFEYGYTVSESLANEFKLRYKKNYITIRNMPVLQELTRVAKSEKYLFYQGAVNEGRAFEYLIPAMKWISYKLIICGDGNFMEQLKKLIKENNVEEKVELKGMMLPQELLPLAQKAALGMGLADREGIHQFLALPNKFFDYVHAGLPQIAMAYPEYEKINNEYKVAVLIDSLEPAAIAKKINEVMEDEELLKEMHNNCLKAKNIFCWQHEEKILVKFYKNIFVN